MDTHTKIKAAPLLKAAASAGFTIRGFTGIVGTRGSRTRIKAKSITRNEEAISRLYVGSVYAGHFFVVWHHVGSDSEHRAEFDVALRDDGELRFTPRSDGPEVKLDEPAWH